MIQGFPLEKQTTVLAENLLVITKEIRIKCASGGHMEPGCVTIDGKPAVGLFFRGA